MPCGAFNPESTGTVGSACPVCLGSGKASTVPSLMSVTSSMPPGLKVIWRACGASAKTAIWKPGGSFSRARSIFSAWLQDSSYKGNKAEIQARTRQARIGQARLVTFNPRIAVSTDWLITAAVVTGLPQLFAVIFCSRTHAVFISDFAKITRRLHFFGPAWRSAALQCVVRHDLDFP